MSASQVGKVPGSADEGELVGGDLVRHAGLMGLEPVSGRDDAQVIRTADFVQVPPRSRDRPTTEGETLILVL